MKETDKFLIGTAVLPGDGNRQGQAYWECVHMSAGHVARACASFYIRCGGWD